MRAFPTREEIESIANGDPRLAYMLVAGPRRQIQVMTASAIFPEGSVVDGTPLPASLDQQLPEEFYVIDFAYQVETPNANAGSLFKGQQDYYNALSPGISGRINVTAGIGGFPYVVNTSFTPIEGLARQVNQPEGGPCSWTNGWHLGLSSSVNIDLILTRAYADSQLPVKVTFFFHSQYIACRSRFDLPLDQAVKELSGLGFKVPERFQR